MEPEVSVWAANMVDLAPWDVSAGHGFPSPALDNADIFYSFGHTQIAAGAGLHRVLILVRMVAMISHGMET